MEGRGWPRWAACKLGATADELGGQLGVDWCLTGGQLGVGWRLAVATAGGVEGGSAEAWKCGSVEAFGGKREASAWRPREAPWLPRS